MPSPTFSDAYKEALVCVPRDNPTIETLAIEHPDEETIYIAFDWQDWTAYLEDGVTEVTFQRGWFDLRQPPKNADGVPELQIALANADGEVGAYIERIKFSEKPVEAVFRPYLADDPSGPSTNPPLRLQVKNVQVTLFQAQGRALFARDMKNTLVPTERYTRSRFPGLAG